MEARSDSQLLDAVARQRDREAFTELFERYRLRLFGMSMCILRERALAEDAVQEAMLAIWLSPPQSLPQGETQNWIFRILLNKSINLGRSRRRSAHREELMAEEKNRTQSSSGEQAGGDELIAVLRSQLEKLPQLEAQLLACCYGANMSHEKIGELLGMPRRTISNRIQQALERLRANLTGAGVAAVVPLLSSEKLFEALTAGNGCPARMTERLLSSLDSPAALRQAANASRRAAALGGKSSAGMLALLMAIGLGAGGAWWALHSYSPARPQPATPASVTPAAAASKPFHAHWDFSKAAPTDLPLFQGEWQWQGADARGGAGMNITADVSAAFLLPQSIPGPVLVSFKLFVPPNITGGFGCYWANDKQVLSGKVWHSVNDVAGYRIVNHNAYLFGRYVVICLDDKPTSIVEYPIEYPGNRICVTLKNMLVMEMDARSISIDEIPAQLRDPEKLIKAIKTPSADMPAFKFERPSSPADSK